MTLKYMFHENSRSPAPGSGVSNCQVPAFSGVTMGQLALSQFFLYGKRHFTSSGWEMHKANYAQPDRAVVPQWYDFFLDHCAVRKKETWWVLSHDSYIRLNTFFFGGSLVDIIYI